MNQQIRQLNLDSFLFGWRVTRKKISCPTSPTSFVWVEKLLVFHIGTSKSSLRISFAAGTSGGSEFVSRHGLIMFYSNGLLINLNKPRTVEILTRQAISLGWSKHSPMTVEDGFSFVIALPAASQQLIDEGNAFPLAQQ